MIKYSPNMTDAEKAAMQREIEELDRSYALAEAFDAANAPDREPTEEELEEADQTETLHRAALNRGQP